MLTPEQWEEIGKQAEGLYNQLELEIIEEIAERIANVGYANTVVINNTKIAQEMGIMYQDIIRLVAKQNEMTENKIKEIFEKAGIKSLKYDDKIYKEVGLKTIPIRQSKSMWQLLETTAKKTSNNLSNLAMTTAETSQTTFYNAINKANMEVSTGVKSYTQSIIDTIKEISNKGAHIKYPSGRKLSLETAIRMNIVTGINQTCGKMQLMRAEELEWDLMELTAHIGARPTHASWQGKIVSRIDEIIERKDGLLIVEVTKNAQGEVELIPMNNIINYPIKMNEDCKKVLVEGDRIIVKIDLPENNIYIAEFVKNIGHKDDPDADLKLIAINNNIPIEFSLEALKEAENIPDVVLEEEKKGRLDLTNKLIFSIDGANTKDRDDAISLEINEKGNYVLGVHIADVTHYIYPGMKLWKEALMRATSVYMVNTVIPMLHHKLSNGIC